MTLTLTHAHGVLTWSSPSSTDAEEMNQLLDNWRRWSAGRNAAQFVFISHNDGATKIWYRHIHSINITD